MSLVGIISQQRGGHWPARRSGRRPSGWGVGVSPHPPTLPPAREVGAPNSGGGGRLPTAGEAPSPLARSLGQPTPIGRVWGPCWGIWRVGGGGGMGPWTRDADSGRGGFGGVVPDQADMCWPVGPNQVIFWYLRPNQVIYPGPTMALIL